MSDWVGVLIYLLLAGICVLGALSDLFPAVPLGRRISATVSILGAVGTLAAAWHLR